MEFLDTRCLFFRVNVGSRLRVPKWPLHNFLFFSFFHHFVFVPQNYSFKSVCSLCSSHKHPSTHAVVPCRANRGAVSNEISILMLSSTVVQLRFTSCVKYCTLRKIDFCFLTVTWACSRAEENPSHLFLASPLQPLWILSPSKRVEVPTEC